MVKTSLSKIRRICLQGFCVSGACFCHTGYLGEACDECEYLCQDEFFQFWMPNCCFVLRCKRYKLLGDSMKYMHREHALVARAFARLNALTIRECEYLRWSFTCYSFWSVCLWFGRSMDFKNIANGTLWVFFVTLRAKNAFCECGWPKHHASKHTYFVNMRTRQYRHIESARSCW